MHVLVRVTKRRRRIYLESALDNALAANKLRALLSILTSYKSSDSVESRGCSFAASTILGVCKVKMFHQWVHPPAVGVLGKGDGSIYRNGRFFQSFAPSVSHVGKFGRTRQFFSSGRWVPLSDGNDALRTEESSQAQKENVVSVSNGLRWKNNVHGDLDERGSATAFPMSSHRQYVETEGGPDSDGSSSVFQLETGRDSAELEESLSEKVLGGEQSRRAASLYENVLPQEQEVSFAKPDLAKEMDLALRAVQLAAMLSQRVQQRILQKGEIADQKKDRSLVTVADWGVQALVSWVLSQGLEGEALSMVAEEDTKGLRGREKFELLQRVVSAVNECLQEAGIVGLSPPAQSLGALDVLKAISMGSSEGGKSGRYWVLDPVDGTLGFVRGDQYAIALALIENGEVILAVLGCPNFPLKKEWLRYHHRYYRLASKLQPPGPGEWHKGMILTTIKGSGQVIMQPLVVNADGLPQGHMNMPAPRRVRVSPVDDPVKATFCEPVEKSNSSHAFTAGLALSLGLRNRSLRVYSMAKYAAIARGDAEIFMKFARDGYKEKIWDHAAGVLLVQEAGGVVTDAAGQPLHFSQGRFLTGLDRGIIASSGVALHKKLLVAVDASWNSSRL